MSYARFVEGSDVYVFLACNGHLECCGCALKSDGRFLTTDAMIAHLREHEAAGHDVPDHIYPDLEADREENDAWIAEAAP